MLSPCLCVVVMMVVMEEEEGGWGGTPKALVLDSGAEVCPTRAYTCDRMRESGGVCQQGKNKISKFRSRISSS